MALSGYSFQGLVAKVKDTELSEQLPWLVCGSTGLQLQAGGGGGGGGGNQTCSRNSVYIYHSLMYTESLLGRA